MLTYTIPEKKEKPIYEYLYENIKKDIFSGILKPNEKLPSKRNLAKQLNISLITIEKAYEQLIVEGYIYSIEKKGYFVEELNIVSPQEKTIEYNTQQSKEVESIYVSRFPYSIWNSLSRKVLSNNTTIKQSPFKGDLKLRQAITKHLNDFHNMQVDPECIIVGAGSEYLYTLLIQYFGNKKTYALENPGHLNIAKIYRANNARFNYINLDSSGISINDLIKKKSDIIHISPAHHFPTGIVMPLKRRMELLKWAYKQNGIIIEDDYDSEFRFTGKPIPPLYQLEGGNRVIYMNTFSKSLSPSFRIAYLVLPRDIKNDFEEKLGFYHNTVSCLEQMVLANFISEGYFERHINRERKYYRQLHKNLCDKLNPLLKKYNLELIDSVAGLHFLIKHKFDIEDSFLEDLLKKEKLPIHTMAHYTSENIDSHKLIISYSNLQEENIDDLIQSLNSLFEQIKYNS